MKAPVYRKDNLFWSKDEEEVCLLISSGLEIIDHKRVDRRVVFYFDRKSAMPYIQLLKSNKPIPISDIRTFFSALKLFRQIVHEDG